MEWSVYLLSIIDNLMLITTVSVITLLASLLVLVVSALRHSAILKAVECDECGQYTDEYPTLKRMIKLSARTLIISITIVLISLSFPSRNSILKAYIMVEGSKVANANNSEKAIEETLKRIDRFLDIVEKATK